MKFYFVFICLIFWIIYETEGQTAKCDYKNQYYWTSGYSTSTASYYKCNIDTEKANFNKKIKKITGQHGTGHSDADIKWIGNYKTHKLKIFSSTFCQKFPNLEIVRIDNAELESFDENSLQNCKNLDRLFLFRNKIQKFPENLLTRNLKLTFIDFKNNQLTTLPENIFLNQKNLRGLDLDDNQINLLPSNIFRSLVKIEVIYLHNNKLQSINPDWFISLKNLRLLYLNGNQISEIPSKCFASLVNLERLLIYENRVKIMDSDSFEGLQNLQLLSLFKNEISDLPVGVFSHLKSLQGLFLYNNKLSSIHADSFGVHSRLATIWINDNLLNAIDPKFIANTAVLYLNMNNNICGQFLAETRSEIPQKLKKCFENYKPRGQHQLLTGQSILVENVCGKSSIGQGNIVGGLKTVRGSYPWIAALITPAGQFFCGGTLISNRKVLTAAHCIQDKHTTKAISASEFLVQLGVYDLNKTVEVGRVPYAIETVNIHPGWNIFSESFDADIAVLVLDTDVTFNKYIQPICMPNLPNFIPNNNTGIVVGFGKSEDTTKFHENIPKMLETPIHSNEACFFHYHSLIKLSSRRTFCGGTGTGVGVCKGDSGSGLFVTDGSAYYIRGIVSSSIIGGPYGCDLNVYSIFTDVSKYIKWINGINSSQFEIS